MCIEEHTAELSDFKPTVQVHELGVLFEVVARSGVVRRLFIYADENLLIVD